MKSEFVTLSAGDLIAPKTAAGLLGISKSTLNRWAADGIIHYVVLPSGCRRYIRERIEQVIGIKSETVKPPVKYSPERRKYLEDKLRKRGILQ